MHALSRARHWSTDHGRCHQHVI